MRRGVAGKRQRQRHEGAARHGGAVARRGTVARRGAARAARRGGVRQRRWWVATGRAPKKKKQIEILGQARYHVTNCGKPVEGVLHSSQDIYNTESYTRDPTLY